MQESELISQFFTFGDLLVTNQSLSEPNITDNASFIENMKVLGLVLDELMITIGPFQILSGFRTKELQTKLGEGGNPTSKSLSFHEVGRAVDIYPTEMTIDEYFARILANEDLKNKFSEISIKKSQNSLHLAVNVPGDWRTPRVLGLTASKSYALLSPEEIQSYIDSVSEFAASAVDAASTVVSRSRVPILVTLGLVGVAAIFILTSGSRRTV